MKNPSGKKKLRADIIVIAALLFLALALYLALNTGRREGGVAVVRVNGVETERHSLLRNGTFPLNGGTNVLVIEDGYAWMSEADCPDHICVRQGKIHYTGQVITCLPNRLTVTVEGGEDNGVDLVVG